MHNVYLSIIILMIAVPARAASVAIDVAIDKEFSIAQPEPETIPA
jgi:hypothetical protein